MTTVKEALTWASKQLSEATESPSLDADVLLAHITGESKAFLYGHPESVIKEDEWQGFRALIKRRANGEPIAYLTGEKEFYGRTFRVTQDVLIPRPDTELLVDTALDEFDNSPVTVADIGTGSGAVAIMLKIKAPRMHVIATDVSKDALAVAKGNAEIHDVEIAFAHGNLTEPLKSPVDGLIANLPYLTIKETENPTLSYEPTLALSGGKDGLDLFHTFFLRAPEVIKPNGRIFLEIGHAQAAAVQEMALETFPTADVEVKKDLGDFDRVVMIRLHAEEQESSHAMLASLKKTIGGNHLK